MVAQFASSQDFFSLLAKTRGQKKVVFTNGCFDLLHMGHIHYLNEAKKLGDLLIVGVNSDASVRRLKGDQRPIQCEADRAEILNNLKAVDHAIIFEQDTPEKLIEAVRPDFLVKGGDWAPEKILGSKFVQSYGGRVLSLPFVPGRSTSEIVKKILS